MSKNIQSRSWQKLLSARISMDSSIKKCKAKLEFLTNTNVSLIVSKGIRIGKFNLLLRYARAKNTEKLK